MSNFLSEPFIVDSDNVRYDNNTITAKYNYESTRVIGNTVTPITEQFLFQTDRKVPKLGLMLVGWGGNNGTTVTAGILANRHNLKWNTKEGEQCANYYGSLTQASTVRLGINNAGEAINIPFHTILPMVNPNDLVLTGWDINSMDLSKAMKRAKVLDYDLQKQLIPLMKDMKPLPSIYSENFIAANQSERANNLIHGTKAEQMEVIRKNIRDFKANSKLDKVIVLWTANTERFCDVVPSINGTADALLNSIQVS